MSLHLRSHGSAALLGLTFLIPVATSSAAQLVLREDADAQTISVFRVGEPAPLVTQHADADFRPYLHPISGGDGRGVLTQFSPTHHPHHTGLFWGLGDVNGRDYLRHPGRGYWRRVSSGAVPSTGAEVKWSTVYELLAADGTPVMRETQSWTMRDLGDSYWLDFEWSGHALVDVTVGKS